MAIATEQLQSTPRRRAAQALTGARADYDPLMDLIGNAHCVLIGEASHGTHEFQRAELAETDDWGFRSTLYKRFRLYEENAGRG